MIILLGTGLVYVFGYICWSINAWSDNIGPVPGIQLQYFTAGFPFLVMCLLVLAIVKAGDRVRKNFHSVFLKLTDAAFERAKRRVPLTTKSIIKSLVILFVGCIILLFFVARTSPWIDALRTATDPISLEIEWLYFIIFVGALLACFLISAIQGACSGTAISLQAHMPFMRTRPHGSFTKTLLSLLNGHVPLILFFAIATLSPLYVFSGYRKIPQEFGGIRRRYAYFDVKRSELSPQLRTEILPIGVQNLPPDISKDSTPVVRTQLLDVYYVGSDFIMIRPHFSLGLVENDSPAIQIKNEVITGIIWLKDLPPSVERFDLERRHYLLEQSKVELPEIP